MFTRCLADGIDVRGFFVWSLLDNFEWNMGFGPKLGLHAVDRTTFERRPSRVPDWFGAWPDPNRLPSASTLRVRARYTQPLGQEAHAASVLAISRLHRQRWASLLGMLPRTKRDTPLMPRFPTTMRSAPTSWRCSATRRRCHCPRAYGTRRIRRGVPPRRSASP